MASCPSCARDVAAGFAFCPHCGAPIEASAPSGEERKLVTLLFADITGSTGLAESLDAEVVHDLMGEYFALAREEIEARGGTVEKFIGDAVMAVFGVPIAHEDDPARAMQAALAIRTRLAEVRASSRTEGAPALQVRIGVNTGEVVATTNPRPGEGMVTGDAVNVAARIQQMAEPGQILVGERTAASGQAFSFRDLGARAVRGKSAQVVVRELIEERVGASPRGVQGLRSPLIGRDREMNLLVSLYERTASEGRPHLVTLYGDPGVGKSRLTIEFLRRLADGPEPPLVVRGRCLSYGSGATFWPLAEVLKSQAGYLDSDPPAEVSRKVLEFGTSVISAEVAEDPARATALLGYTVGIPVPGYEFGRLEPDQLRAEVHGAWRSLFSGLATRGAVVVVVEDIHWADDALLDLLEEVSDRVQGSVLFLCPSRPELTGRRTGWGGGRRSFSGVALDPLPEASTSELVDHLLTVAELPDALRARIVARAEGNPFFVEEILRQLIDEGGLIRDGDAWHASAGIGEVEIPDTVQAVLAARIDLLQAEEKRTLQAAAVVGRVFWPAPVARFLNGSAATLDGLLRGLEGRDLILSRLSSTMAGQSEFIFKHALVRDVAYESIPRKERAAAHLQVADWIEEAVGERRVEMVELLAHHYTEAQRAVGWAKLDAEQAEIIRARSVELLYEAGREAARHLAPDRARERAEAGLELSRGPLERAEGLELLVGLDLWADNGDAAWRYGCEAVDLRMEANPQTDAERLAVVRTIGTLLSIPTRWPGLMRDLPTREEAARYLDLGFELVPDGDSEERLRLLLARGAWSWGFRESETDLERIHEDRAAADEAVEMARRMGRVELLSAALDTLGATGMLMHGYRGMLDGLEERTLLIPALDDQHEIMDIYSTGAWCRAHIGQFRTAADLGRRSSELAARIGINIPAPTAFMGLAQFRMGLWPDFWETFASAEAAIDPDRPLRYHAHRLYGMAAFLREVYGEPAEADRLIDRIDQSSAASGQIGVSGARLWIVMTLARRGAFDDARRRLDLRDPVRAIQNRDLDFEAWADLIAAQGAWGEAQAIVDEARAWAFEAELLFLPAVADRLAGQAALAGGDPETAISLLENARATFERLEAPWDRGRAELPLARALLSVGRHQDAASAANAALVTFRGLGAAREIQAAEDLIAPPSARSS